MTWNIHHSASEKLVAEAELAFRSDSRERAQQLYDLASSEEIKALDALPLNKARTRGITAVNAVALSYKAKKYASAERLAHRYLSESGLPQFAEVQLRNLLQAIWNALAGETAGLLFSAENVLVSLKGGDIIHGGAPLDLIRQKTEGLSAILFRTVELLLKQPVRRRGQSTAEIQSMFTPWLFQALPGSYQFALRVEEPKQLSLWDSSNKPSVQRLTETFLQILRASANDPEKELVEIVPEKGYRDAFLRLSRNLAPPVAGGVFERIEIHDSSAPNEPVASFTADTRERLNAALRKSVEHADAGSGELIALRGILRNLHLDKDWFEIRVADSGSAVRITGMSDVLDDVIGPMVNHLVTVSVIRRANTFSYRDIELAE